MQQFHQLILNWFDQNGRKHLPWQQNKNPYRVWISEIMLQQTQVATVIPYFTRFMQQFPDLKKLAHANEDKVLHLWAGLGYYSRARNLHKTAKKIIEAYKGQFPDTLAELQNLPGIGKSTASAILSLAFNQPAAILDGNVKRVFTRFYGITDPIDKKNVENKLWEYAKQNMSLERPADYTQAMMDLGALVCTQKKPQCNACPLIENCIAFNKAIAEELPKKKPRSKLPTRNTTFLLLLKDRRILLYKRPAMGIWGGLWSVPEITGKPKSSEIQIFCQRYCKEQVSFELLKPFRHTFTHFHLNIFPVLIKIKKLTAAIKESNEIWFDLDAQESRGLPKPTQQLLKELQNK